MKGTRVPPQLACEVVPGQVPRQDATVAAARDDERTRRRRDEAGDSRPQQEAGEQKQDDLRHPALGPTGEDGRGRASGKIRNRARESESAGVAPTNPEHVTIALTLALRPVQLG